MEKRAKQKKPKQLFRKRSPIPIKWKIGMIIGLLIALIIFMIIPYLWWDIPLAKCIVWGLVLVFLMDGLLYFVLYDYYVKLENGKTEERNKYKSAYESQKEQKEKLKKRVEAFDRDKAEVEKERDNALEWAESVSAYNDKLEEYKQTLKEIYLCSRSAETRAYADECFRRRVFYLFQPIRYLQDTNYARVLDVNAEKLLKLFGPENDLFHANEVEKELNKLLKKGGTGGAGGSSAPVLTRDRQTLKKIDNEMEL